MVNGKRIFLVVSVLLAIVLLGASCQREPDNNPIEEIELKLPECIVWAEIEITQKETKVSKKLENKRPQEGKLVLAGSDVRGLVAGKEIEIKITVGQVKNTPECETFGNGAILYYTISVTQKKSGRYYHDLSDKNDYEKFFISGTVDTASRNCVEKALALLRKIARERGKTLNGHTVSIMYNQPPPPDPATTAKRGPGGSPDAVQIRQDFCKMDENDQRNEINKVLDTLLGP